MADICFSSVESYEEGLADYRVLFMEMEFHQIHSSSLLEAAITFAHSINDLQSDQFIMDWNINHLKGNQKTIDNVIRQQFKDKLIISADGVIKNNRIPNISAFRKYQRNLFLNPVSYGVSSYSTDYPNYFRTNLVPFLDNDALLKDSLLKLFQLEGKKPLGRKNIYDSGCIFIGGRHSKKTNPQLFWGKLEYYVSVNVCGQFLDKIAERLCSILYIMAAILKHTNGRIGIGPQKIDHISSYMTYFGGGYDNTDGSHIDANFSPSEWYPYYYICGVEWMNYLSALPANRIRIKQMDGITSLFQNDGMIIKVNRPISKMKIQDLSKIKACLSSVLYPGKSTIDVKQYYNSDTQLYSMLPRSNWEIVPISNDEIYVKDSVVTFSHRDTVCK